MSVASQFFICFIILPLVKELAQFSVLFAHQITTPISFLNFDVYSLLKLFLLSVLYFTVLHAVPVQCFLSIVTTVPCSLLLS